MPALQQEGEKRSTLNLRVKAELRGLIDRAAEISGETLTDFVLGAAQRAAEERLLKQTLFKLSPEAFDLFVQQLDAPPAPNERLRRSLQAVPPWER
jgi:uncharacterized protein (DUF1778 family)